MDAGGVRTVTGVPTGLAMISVDPAGENLITVAPGANHEVGAGEVAAAASSPGDVLVICAEIPVPAIRAALARASADRRPLHPQPRPSPADAAEAAAIVAGGVDWLVVNETEAAAVLGRKVEGLTDAAQAAAGLLAAGARHAVVTAGAHGAALAPTARRAPRSPSRRSGSRRSTPLGPATPSSARSPSPWPRASRPAEAVRAAAAAGATAATRPGAQAGMPRPADIRAATGLTWPVR